MNVYTPLEITVGEHYNTAYSMAIDSPILALLWSLEIVVLAFSSLAKDFGRTVDRLFPACAFFFFFLKWRLARAHVFHSLYQNQSTMAQRAEMTLTSCV